MSLKNEILLRCQEELQLKINDLQRDLESLTISLRSETKNTAGDKHETSRAMVQLEIESFSKNLNEKFQQLEFINRLINSPELAKCYYTNSGVFLLAIGLGKIMVGNTICFIVSKDAPIGKLLLAAKEGDSISINNRSVQLEKVE
jgi:hypothetical protein